MALQNASRTDAELHAIKQGSKATSKAPSDTIIECRIPRHQPTGPIVYPPSSRTIARRREKTEAVARSAAAARAIAAQVQPAVRSPGGRLFAVDVAALLMRGPLGGIGTTERMACTLVPLAAGGRHPVAVLAAAGGWADEAALREALAALAPKLGAIGLRVCRRKAGLRIARVKPLASPTAAG